MNLLLLFLSGLGLLFLAGAAFTHLHARLVEKRYPPTGRFIEVEGCRLHYVEKGPPEPLGTIVLLHGASSNLVESMLDLGRPLVARYRVLAFDRPGHGWSRRRGGIEAADPARQARVMAEALRRLSVRNAVIVGHSWSGTIVPHFGLDHTDVAGALLILSGITHPWPGGYMGWYRRLVASWLGLVLTHTVAVPVTLLLQRRALRRTFAPQSPPPDFLRKAFIPLAFRPRAYQANGHDFAVMYEALVRQSSRYGEIDLPTVVIGGDMDEIVWTDLHSRSFARDVPGAKLIVLPGVGHMPQCSGPELVVETIEALAERAASIRANIV